MKNKIVLEHIIEPKIFMIRGHRIMLDKDLAKLYGVPTKVLNQAVKRNINRFPDDFMFQLSKEEMENWISQIVISNKEKMGLRKRPYAFTEQGVAMLSSVLKSKRAVHVNIQIMRAFVRLRRMIISHKKLLQKLDELERRMDKHDSYIIAIFDLIKELMKPLPLSPPSKPKEPIGFHP